MKLVVIGCGRVGASLARNFQSDGWDVTAVPLSSADGQLSAGQTSAVIRRAGRG